MTVGIFGPMFAFKSSELFKHIERHVFAKKKVLLIRPEIDNRGYFSHSEGVNQAYRNLHIEIIQLKDVSKIERGYLESFDTIFVDEYFMIKDSYLIAKNLQGKNIFYAGLLASSECKLFPEAEKLLPYCDEIIKLNGVCMSCGSQLGNYSFYKGQKTEDIKVGDSEYEVRCKTCYDKGRYEANN